MKLPVRQEGLPIQPARSLNTHLMSMQEEKEAQSTIFEEIKEYLSVRSRIFSLQVAETTANLISNLISNAAALLFLDRKSTRLELQSLMRISYAVFCLKQKTKNKFHHYILQTL